MKNKILIVTILVLFLGLYSCELVMDIDTTNNKSTISSKPVMNVLGDPIISLAKGNDYIEAGVEAYAGDTSLNVKIVDGEVNTSVSDFYVVTYEATNGFGWKSNAYRAVLVYDGSPYSDDIAGTYKFNNIIDDITISKYDVDGYWKANNAWGAEGIDFPVVFADKGDGNYGIVPDIHPTKGKYSGTAKVTTETVWGTTTTYIEFTITAVSSDGNETTINFKWTKQ